MRDLLSQRTTAGTLALALLTIACGNGRPAERADASPDTVRQQVMSATPQDSLELQLIVAPRVRTGDTVPITLRVRNPTARTMDLYLRGRAPTIDVVVEREDGATVWRRLEGEVIPAIVHLRPLGGGGTFDVQVTWDQRTRAGRSVGAGTYRVRGTLLLEDSQRESGAATLEILSR
jgi:hypothetical protein